MTYPQLTIATTTFNSLAYTQLFVTFLQRYADVPYHLIIVDNHSSDGTLQYLGTLPNVEIVANKRNLGFAQANNQAFTRTKTPYFLGLNNDTAIFPGFLSSLLTAAKKYPEYGELGVHSNCIGALDPRTGATMWEKMTKPHNASARLLEEQLSNYYGDYAHFFAVPAKRRGKGTCST